MTDEQTEQLERIRERYTAALEIIARRGFASEAPQWAMIGFLLGLVDSQVAAQHKNDDALARFVNLSMHELLLLLLRLQRKPQLHEQTRA